MKTTHHAFALLGATLLAACQADSNPGNISAGDSPRSGSQWVLVAGQLNGKPLNVQDGTVTLTQEKDAFTGVSAINHYRVPVKIRGGNIEHPEPPTTTLMAGPVEAMRLESDYLEAMSAVKHLKREGDSLTAAKRPLKPSAIHRKPRRRGVFYCRKPKKSRMPVHTAFMTIPPHGAPQSSNPS